PAGGTGLTSPTLAGEGNYLQFQENSNMLPAWSASRPIPDPRRGSGVTQGSEARDLDADVALRVIANPAQRRVLEVVAGGGISSGALAAACGLTRAATSQHLRALREAALVQVRVDGNRRLYRVRMENLARLRAFLDEFWASRLGLLVDSLAKSERSR